MPSEFVNLPWLNPPDPVAAYSHGLQLGMQAGTEQARQQFQQQQAIREDQQQAIQNAHQEALFHMQSEQQARKFAAQQRYQTLLQQGMDPAKALLQVGPELGMNMEGLAMQQHVPQITPFQQAELQQRSQESERTAEYRKQQLDATAQAKKAALDATESWRKFQEELRVRQQQDKEDSFIDPVDKAELSETVKELAAVNKQIASTPLEKPGFFGGGNVKELDALKSKAQELTDKINSFRKKTKSGGIKRFRFNRDSSEMVPVESQTEDTDTQTDTESDNQ